MPLLLALDVKVRCHRNPITFGGTIYHNTYSYQARSISESSFSVIVQTQTHRQTPLKQYLFCHNSDKWRVRLYAVVECSELAGGVCGWASGDTCRIGSATERHVWALPCRRCSLHVWPHIDKRRQQTLSNQLGWLYSSAQCMCVQRLLSFC